MLQKNNTVNESEASPFAAVVDAPLRLRSAIHLNTSLTTYAIIEFLAVAGSAYFGSGIYHFVSFHWWQTSPTYVLAAAAIATLVLISSLGFHNFSGFPKQPRHI